MNNDLGHLPLPSTIYFTSKQFSSLAANGSFGEFFCGIKAFTTLAFRKQGRASAGRLIFSMDMTYNILNKPGFIPRNYWISYYL
jgi:hypothetical protein